MEMKSVGLQQRLARSVDYEDYAATSAKYDDTRVTIGLEIIVGCLAIGRRLDQQVVLDAGCGTGNYLEALGDFIGFGYGIDINGGMVEEAKKKLRHRPNISVDHGDLSRLPYDANFFDGIICTQVLHHLDYENKAGMFPNVRNMLAESCRVLHPRGVIILNTCAREQLFEAFWWADLIPEAVGRMAAAHARHRSDDRDAGGGRLRLSAVWSRPCTTFFRDLPISIRKARSRRPSAPAIRLGRWSRTGSLARATDRSPRYEPGREHPRLPRGTRRTAPSGRPDYVHFRAKGRLVNQGEEEVKDFQHRPQSMTPTQPEDEANRYSRCSILRSKKMYGEGFQSPGVNGGAKLVHPGGAKLVHLMLCGTRCWGVVPVVHRRDPRCFV